MDESFNSEYGVLIHGIHDGTLDEKIQIAEKIGEEGLRLPYGAKSLQSTAISLGKRNNSNFGSEVFEYKYGNGERCNVVIVVPNYLENTTGEKLYLGVPPYNIDTAARAI